MNLLRNRNGASLLSSSNTSVQQVCGGAHPNGQSLNGTRTLRPTRYLPHQPFSIPAVITHSPPSSDQNLYSSSPTGLSYPGPPNGALENVLLVQPSSTLVPPATGIAFGSNYVIFSNRLVSSRSKSFHYFQANRYTTVRPRPSNKFKQHSFPEYESSATNRGELTPDGNINLLPDHIGPPSLSLPDSMETQFSAA